MASEPNSRSLGWRKVLYWAGASVTVYSMAFVVARLLENETWRLLGSDGWTMSRLVLLGFAYAGLCGVAGIGWMNLLGAARGQRLDSVCSYALIQMCKYVPGNVLHVVGRYGLSRAIGIGRPQVLRALVGEQIFTALAALGISLLGSAEVLRKIIDYLPERNALYVAGAGALLAGAAVALLGRGSRFVRPPQLALVAWRGATAVTLYLLFFLGAGLLFSQVLSLLAPDANVPLPVVVSLASVAWLAGYVVPGAPGGIGVRETVLVLSLSAFAPEDAILAAAVAYRGVTVTGDLLFGLPGFYWWYTRGKAVVRSSSLPSDEETQ